MLEAAAGYFDGERIVLNEPVTWKEGQKVVVTTVPAEEKVYPAITIDDMKKEIAAIAKEVELYAA